MHSIFNTLNAANEWTNRRIAKAGTDKDEYGYTYDAVGNLTGESLTLYRGGSTANSSRTFVYDVFGRLAEVNVPGTEEGPVVIARYRYNGLSMRIMWQDDADADATLESSERFYVCHDERWRPVGTFRDEDASPKEAFVYHAAGQGGFGGSSYIDSVILRDRDNYTSSTPNPMTSEADGTLEERRFYCQNWRADVVAITKSDGVPIEHVRYSSYGEPTVYPLADVNMDGVVNSADDTDYSNLLYSSPSGAVFADSDIDADGLDGWTGADTDLFYESYAENVGKSGKGRVSSTGVGNRKGYAAYEWDQVIRANHVRYRVYFPEIGRWGRRDPAGYVDKQSLFAYVQSRCIATIDPHGLAESWYGDPWTDHPSSLIPLLPSMPEVEPTPSPVPDMPPDTTPKPPSSPPIRTPSPRWAPPPFINPDPMIWPDIGWFPRPTLAPGDPGYRGPGRLLVGTTLFGCVDSVKEVRESFYGDWGGSKNKPGASRPCKGRYSLLYYYERCCGPYCTPLSSLRTWVGDITGTMDDAGRCVAMWRMDSIDYIKALTPGSTWQVDLYDYVSAACEAIPARQSNLPSPETGAPPARGPR